MDTHNSWHSNDKNACDFRPLDKTLWLLAKAGSKAWQEWIAECPHNAPSLGMWHPLPYLCSSLLPIEGRTNRRWVARATGSRHRSPGGADLCLWNWGGPLGQARGRRGEAALHSSAWRLGHSWLYMPMGSKKKFHLHCHDLILLTPIPNPAPQIMGTQ